MNLFDVILEPFKGNRHCVVADSAYMGDNMALIIGCYEWKLNMVGTTQANQVGAVVKEVINAEITRNTYNCIFWQHNKEPLTLVAWLDNNMVITVSNFHCAEILTGESGVYRKKRVNGSREHT